MQTFVLTLLCVLGNVIEITTAVNPGLKVRLSQSGLNYAAQVAVEIMSSKVSGKSLPDQSGTADIKVGKVDWGVTGMKITSFQQPGTSLVVNPGSGLTWSITGAGVSVHGNWHYKYRLGFITIKDSGSFDASVSGASVSVSVTIGASATGEPTITSTGCSCNIDRLKIDIHGGASWLYDLFIGFIEKPMRDSLQSQICNEARNVINNEVAHELSTLKVKVVIDKLWLLDYSLVSAPGFASGYFDSYHKGEFFLASDPTEAPFQPAPLPSPPTTDHMATFWLSEYVLNTAGFVLQKKGILKYNLTRNDLSGKDKDRLNTTCCFLCGCIGEIVPAIGKQYPNTYVEAEMYASAPPVASVDSKNILGVFEGAIVLRARLSNGSLAHLFGINATAKVSVTPSLDGMTVKAKINSMDEALTLISSSIGPVQLDNLKVIFDLYRDAFIIRKLNEAGAKGFPLPGVDHVEFYNANLQLQQNCISVMSDVRYKQ